MLELVNESGAGAVLAGGWNLRGEYQPVLVLRLTLDFDLQGNLRAAGTQPPPPITDIHHDSPKSSSLLAAGEIVPFKQGAEYYLHGKAYTPSGRENRAHVGVEIRQGHVHHRKQLVVLGEHTWERGVMGIKRGEPEPFVSLPLHYEYAYGGSHEKSGRREKHNPVGRGFNPSGWRLSDPRAPRIEYRGQAAVSPAKTCPVAGFAPIPAFWPLRLARFGDVTETPLEAGGCPWGSNAEPTMHHCAPVDQWLGSSFQGGEQVTLQGFFPGNGSVSLVLPGWQPQALLIRRGKAPEPVAGSCDTLVIDTEQRQLALLTRLPINMEMLGNQPAWLRVLAASSLADQEAA